jgi:uncharacterized protein YfiM (DUF2279 family)
MKPFQLACLLSPAVHAQVIECPKFYPWQDTKLAEVPYQHKGQGFVAKAKLAGAGMYTGEINGRGELMGDSSKVKGGWDVQHSFAAGETKWLVCSYGRGDITWWEHIDARATRCTLKLRQGGRDPISATLTCQPG